jgi:hypothetical protein
LAYLFFRTLNVAWSGLLGQGHMTGLVKE